MGAVHGPFGGDAHQKRVLQTRDKTRRHGSSLAVIRASTPTDRDHYIEYCKSASCTCMFGVVTSFPSVGWIYRNRRDTVVRFYFWNFCAGVLVGDFRMV